MKRGAAAGSALGTAILALFLLRGSTTGPGVAAVNPTQMEHLAAAALAETQSSPKTWPEDGPWQASRRHFAGKRPEGECPLFMAQGEDPRDKQWCIPPQEQVRAMIAIVPDPVHSHMALVFDRSVEALQLAAQSMNYVIDDYWLPWPTGSDGSRPSTKDQNEKEAYPGLVMFRWNGAASEKIPSVLYVFLVADTSTAGINGTQFSNAVDYVQKVCMNPGQQESGCGNSGRIWIMGPTFSGSLESLRRLTAAKSSPDFTAYSGTVSSLCAIHNQHLFDQPALLEKSFSPACIQPDETSPPHLKFRSLVNDTETAVSKFVSLLQQSKNINCKGHAEIAILSEAATTYGTVGSSGMSRTDSETQRRTDPDDQPVSCELDSFSYPREISSLRNAYQKAVGQTSASGANNSGAAQNSLPFDLTDRQPNNSDEPPDFSMQQGPLSKEAVLMQIGLQLRREHYKYIGVIGSNVLDVLFLSNFLRNACPDARLFVLNSDLMFERQLDNVPYIGMLAVTTYPLVGRNSYWTSQDKTNQTNRRPALKYLPLADQYEEGQYNAALLVMKQVVPAPDPDKNSGLREFREPFVKSQADFDPKTTPLPLWLTAVGTGGYWPIQILTREPESGSTTPTQGLDPILEDVDFSAGWHVITLLLCALAFLHIFILWTASNLKSRFRDFALGCAAPGQRLFFINVASACLALALAMLAAPAWRFGLRAGFSVLAIVVVVPIAILGLLLICAWLNYVFHGIWQKAKEEKQAEARLPFWSKNGLCAVVWVLAVAGAGLWLLLLADGPSHYGFFFAYRTVNLATGVSPFTPMLPLFAASYCWCVFEIWRLRFHDHVRPKLNITNGLPGARSENCIADSVYRYFLNPNYQIVFFLIFGVWLFFFNPFQPFWLFEHVAFSVLYGVLLCILVALTLSGGLRLVQIWSRLRKLLRELEWSPIRLAFSRLKEGSWSPIWESGGQDVEWTNMARSFEVIEQINSCGRDPDAQLKVDDALKQAIEAAVAKRNELRNQLPGRTVSSQQAATADNRTPSKAKADSEILHAVEKCFCELQGLLANVLNACLSDLRGYWLTHCSEEKDELEKGEKQVVVYCQPEKTDEKVLQMQRLEEFVALRYMAFIRCVLGHIKHLLILLAILFSLALISLNVYAFEPHQSLVWSFTAIFAVIGVTILIVLMQLHKDPILSRITGTKPNELGLDFYYRVISFGAVPLLTLLATQFPAIGHYLSSFFQPGLEALK